MSWVDNVRRLIAEQGITQKELAQRSDISETTLSGYLTGRHSPTLGLVQCIADGLGVPMVEIFKEPITAPKDRWVGEWTLEELRSLTPFLEPDMIFDSFVLVPLDEVHDSGYQVMKIVFLRHINLEDKVVGVSCGTTDAVHLNGYGGVGLFKDKYPNGTVKAVDWIIDCLPASRCFRIASSNLLTLEDNRVGETLKVYDTEVSRYAITEA